MSIRKKSLQDQNSCTTCFLNNDWRFKKEIITEVDALTKNYYLSISKQTTPYSRCPLFVVLVIHL